MCMHLSMRLLYKMLKQQRFVLKKRGIGQQKTEAIRDTVPISYFHSHSIIDLTQVKCKINYENLKSFHMVNNN